MSPVSMSQPQPQILPLPTHQLCTVGWFAKTDIGVTQFWDTANRTADRQMDIATYRLNRPRGQFSEIIYRKLYFKQTWCSRGCSTNTSNTDLFILSISQRMILFLQTFKISAHPNRKSWKADMLRECSSPTTCHK